MGRADPDAVLRPRLNPPRQGLLSMASGEPISTPVARHRAQKPLHNPCRHEALPQAHRAHLGSVAVTKLTIGPCAALLAALIAGRSGWCAIASTRSTTSLMLLAVTARWCID